MSASVLYLAHVGHWLETAAYALPPVALVIMLIVGSVVARRAAADGEEVTR